MLNQLKNKWVLLGGISTLAAMIALQTTSSHTPMKHTGQVLATVGNSEVSVLQYNYLLKKIGIQNPSSALKSEITDKLINRELAYQMAVEQKLEQSPDVLLSIEEAKKDILAKAYAEQLSAKTVAPSENDLAHYYNEHPALFAQRKIYHLTEINISSSETNYSTVKTYIQSKRTKDEFTQWLRDQQIAFNAQNVIRAAEQLPIEVVPNLMNSNEGQIQSFESPRGLMIYQLLSAENASVSYEKAKPIIAQYLSKQSSKTTVDTEIAHLRRTRPVQIFSKAIEQKVE